MNIRRLDEQTVALEKVDLLHAELLHQIGVSADPSDSPAAEARLFSSPTHGADSTSDAEWKEYVEPEIRQLFRDAVEVVQADLADFPPADPDAPRTLLVPVKNLEAWIHAMNQARLALSCRYDFTEEDMAREIPTDGDTRALALFQVHFYGLLQEVFLRQLEED